MAFGALGNLAANNANNQVSFFERQGCEAKKSYEMKNSNLSALSHSQNESKMGDWAELLDCTWLSESWENPVSRPLRENLLPSFSFQSLPDLSSTFDPIRGCHCASRWFAASVDFSIVQHDLQESTWAHPSKTHKETPLLPASYRFPCVKWNAPEALCLTSKKMMSGFQSLPLHIWKVLHLKIPPHPAYQCKV